MYPKCEIYIYKSFKIVFIKKPTVSLRSYRCELFSKFKNINTEVKPTYFVYGNSDHYCNKK